MAKKENKPVECEDCKRKINEDNKEEFNSIKRFDCDYIDCLKESFYCDQCFFKEEFLAQVKEGNRLAKQRYQEQKKLNK